MVRGAFILYACPYFIGNPTSWPSHVLHTRMSEAKQEPLPGPAVTVGASRLSIQ